MTFITVLLQLTSYYYFFPVTAFYSACQDSTLKQTYHYDGTTLPKMHIARKRRQPLQRSMNKVNHSRELLSAARGQSISLHARSEKMDK